MVAAAGAVAASAFLHAAGPSSSAAAPVYTEATPTPPAAAEQQTDEISTSRQNAITRTVAKCANAVVGITVREVRTYEQPGFSDPFGMFSNDPYFRQFFAPRTIRQEIKGLGSGFLISNDGYIVTNDHVAGSATKITVTLSGGRKFDAKIIGTDHPTDITLLKIDGSDLPYLRLGNSDNVAVGEWAIAFGNPFGFFETNDHPTVTVGVVSNTKVNLQPEEGRAYRSMIQTDAAINQGNSGGPLLDADGEVIGMNTAIYTPTGGSVGLGFAIPVNRIKSIVQALKKSGKIAHIADPGFQFQALDRDLAHYFGLKQDEGVVVTQVRAHSAASAADIQPGDVILEAQGEKIRSEDELGAILLEARSGDRLSLTVNRYGKTKELSLTLGGTQE